MVFISLGESLLQLHYRCIALFPMKTNLMLIACALFLGACSQKPVFDRQAGDLRMVIDKGGKITVLEAVNGGTNYIQKGEESYLLELSKYGADSAADLQKPLSATAIAESQVNSKIELTYDDGVKLTVLITPKKDYFRMELIDAAPVAEISQIVWGPYKTNMKGLIGEWLGLNRSSTFTIGLLSLEPNTDGVTFNFMPVAAMSTAYGSLMQLASFDHTRGRFVSCKENGYDNLRKSEPIPGVTVIGSSVALFGCQSGKENELDLIEKVELGEGLPHPTFNGTWIKRTKEGQKFCMWGGYTQQDIGEYLKLSKILSARILCRPGGFFSNYGHFDIHPKIYPGGMKAIRENSDEARKNGLGLTLYSLTTFLTPITAPEPYVSPVPDDRLQTWKAESELIRDIEKDDQEIVLQNDKEVSATLMAAANKVIRIDNEIVKFKSYADKGNEIVISECQRGASDTEATKHLKNSRVRFMYMAGYANYYPGTISMSNEFSTRLSKILVEGGFENFIVDGFESCMETGYGPYTGNLFMKNFYDRCKENNKEVLVAGSIFNQYTWHMTSHESWGEGDMERGFRGSMLDYRLYRQLQLMRNLMPHKFGQYYPDQATGEDIEWIMGLVTGWESGVDFSLNIKAIQANPEYNKIVETFSLWEQARAENAFTEQQKMALRQTDVVYKLSHKPDGAWDLKFDHFWQNKQLNVLPPSAMNAKPVNSGPESVRPLSINWSWTHNPGLYNEVGLSDDLIHRGGNKESTWTVDWPSYTESKKSHYPTSKRYFQFVIRLDKSSPCAVNSFRVSVDGRVVEIPVKLQPGQYLSIPHTMEFACIYNANHEVIGEFYLHGPLPEVYKGKTSTVGISCEPADKGAKPEVVLNVRFQNGFFHMNNFF